MDKKQIIAVVAMVIIALGALFGYDALRDDVTAGAESYVVSAEGYGGEIQLEVFINGEDIVDIQVIEQSETEGLGDEAVNEVIAAILEANSTDVDTVSGATVSSNATISAVEDALAQAGLASGETYNVVVEGYGGDIVLDVIIDGEEITAINIVEHSETEGIGDEALEDVSASIIEAQSLDVDTVSGATVSSEAMIAGVEQALEDAGIELGGGAQEQQGVLGTGSGYGGDIVLDVVVENGEIKEILVVEQSETEGIGDEAIDEMIDKILSEQSTDVDVVSGATVSSEGTIEAVDNALENVDASDMEEYDPQGYVGRALGFYDNSEIVLDVIIEDGEIKDIIVMEQNETKGIGDGAINAVIDRIIENQSTDVDVQTGATVSSKSTMEAVEMAMAKADGTYEEPEASEEYEAEGLLGKALGFYESSEIVLDVIMDGNEIVDIEILAEDETQGIGDAAVVTIIDRIIAQQSTDVDVQTGATVSSNATMEAVQNALDEEGITLEEREASLDYDPEGTLGTGNGYGGDIVLDIITDGDEIVDIIIVSENETDGLGDTAVEEIIDAVLEAQSTDVDMVSGATASSEGAIEAIENGLE